MKFLKIVPLFCALMVFMGCGLAQARADTVDLYTSAVMTGDAAALEKLLAPNFWYIGANGHIRDKEHFIQEIRDRKLVVDRLTLTNIRQTKVGDTTLLTANGEFHGKSEMPRPEGLMRYTMVIANNKGNQEVTLFQATPVISTAECKDGNCKIK